MTRKVLILSFLLTLAAPHLHAAVIVREFGMQPLAGRDTARGPREQALMAAPATNAVAAPSPLELYPIGGTVGRDVAVPYFVDLDPTSVRRDWNCGDLTFNDHTGHDAYIRSFAEQRIGVPVFAARDGVVTDVHDGEADENTTNDTNARANYVTVKHNADELMQYVHLRSGIPVKVGDTVTAGTQIGWVGSSGMSMGPHLHFEARVNGTPFEPMAGPCRAGISYFAEQPPMYADPLVLGATFSRRSFAEVASPPHDDVSRTGTFVAGPQTIFFKVEMANVGASTRYKLMLEPPDSTRTEIAASGVLKSIDTSLASIWWGLETDLNRTGTWAAVLEVNGRRVFSLPFTVVASNVQVVNRSPNAVTAEIGPKPLLTNRVAVCRAVSETLPDPDYDIVRYRYEWRVNGTVVRDVTTAAQSDALARQFVTNDASISCAITPSDGSLSAQTSTAFASPVTAVRRRSSRP